MKLVVDTNVLFSFFSKDSTTRKLISDFKFLDLYTPSFCFEELNKYKDVILKKSKLSEIQFKEIVKELFLFVKPMSFESKRYKQLLQKAKEISPDKDDVEFFALALKLNCAIWSNELLNLLSKSNLLVLD